jgi:hypothetical protein
MEYSGSFDKDEVIHNLTTNEGFRMQGCAVDANKTILDNRGLIRAEVTFYCAFYGGHFKAQNTIRVAFFGRFYSICRHLESIL